MNDEKKQFNKIIIVVMVFIISSVFPFYFITYKGPTFTTIYVFSIWAALMQFILGYIITEKRRLIFVIIFWILYFVFVIGVDYYGRIAIDPLLYGLFYGNFFLLCGFIIYKWEIVSRIYDRVAIVIFGYLFQGVYDWIWWIIQYIDPFEPPFGNWTDKFYIDLIIKNSTILSVFIIEVINLILGIIILVMYPKKVWDYLILCFHWLLLEFLTLFLSWNGIDFPYIVLYILIGLLYAIYLLFKYKRNLIYEYFRKFLLWIKQGLSSDFYSENFHKIKAIIE
ncbi:MAG: hypothetical protein ACTSRP_20660 [Candidatus Helarchaeota archaeon]